MIDCTPIVIRPRPNRTPATREFFHHGVFPGTGSASLWTAPGSGRLDPKDATGARPDTVCRPADSNIYSGTLLIPGTDTDLPPAVRRDRPNRQNQRVLPVLPRIRAFSGPAGRLPYTARLRRRTPAVPLITPSPAQDARPSTHGRDPQARGRFPPPASANADPGRNLPDGTFF